MTNFWHKDDRDQSIANLSQYLEHHPGWLFVFDDVDTYNHIKPHLPRWGGTIIITTNNSALVAGSKNNTVDFSQHKKEDGLVMAERYFPHETEDQQAKVAEVMDYLPQGIATAAGYIEGQRGTIGIKGYLDRLKAHTTQTLDQDNDFVMNHENLVKTLEMDLVALRKDSKLPTTERILEALAFLSPDHPVPPSLLKHVLKK